MESFSGQELREFIVESHRNGYASQEAEEQEDGSKIIEHEEGVWSYRDIYYGSRHFPGLEVVRYSDKPVWSMNYYGSITNPDEGSEAVYDFLKEALSRVSAENPFRGPNLEIGDLKYRCSLEGDLSGFNGKEEILKNGNVIYRGFFSGGRIE